MIQPKQSCLSTKQNFSPTKKLLQQHSSKVFNQQVLLSAINKLQLLLTSHGIKIPQNILLMGNNSNDLYALRTVVNSGRTTSEQQMKKIKIELSNYQFELKKNEQDIAQWKLKTKMEKDKQVKKLRLEIIKLEQQMKEDNGKWESKFEEMRKLYEAKYATDLDEALKRMNKQIKSLQHQHENKMEELIDKIKVQRKQMQSQKLCKIQEIEKQSLCELKKQEEKFFYEKEVIEYTHIKHVEEIQSKQQQIILKIKRQNVQQKRKQEEQKVSIAAQKQKIENKVQQIMNQKDQFLKVIGQLKQKIEQIRKDMGSKELACKNMEQNHKRTINNINSNHQQQLQLLKANHNNEMRKLLKENDQKIIEYQKIVQNLESIKQKREKLLRQAQEQLEQKFLQRPARSEDVTKIQKLNHDLMHKHQQLNCTKVELKKNKLERQNNERNYTRLFSANGTRRYSREKQRDRIFRQVNTIDMSFVYKACHKNF